MVTVTTIIPTRNRPALLFDRAITSVFAQTVEDWECLIVGDGTDDETIARCTDLAAMSDRFRFWNLEHVEYADPKTRWRLGGAAAFAFGLTQARGEWVSYLADDDRYSPWHHELLLAKSANADFVYGESMVRPRDGLPTDRIFGRAPDPRPHDIVQGSYIVRRSFGLEVRGDDITASQAWDAEMLSRLLARQPRIERVHAIVHDYFAAPENREYHRLLT